MPVCLNWLHFRTSARLSSRIQVAVMAWNRSRLKNSAPDGDLDLSPFVLGEIEDRDFRLRPRKGTHADVGQ